MHVQICLKSRRQSHILDFRPTCYILQPKPQFSVLKYGCDYNVLIHNKKPNEMNSMINFGKVNKLI